MNRIPRTLIALLILGLAPKSIADSVIVQWGKPGGDTGIVSVNTDFSVKTNTYTPGTVANPAQGATYYPSATGRSPVFNHASNNTSNTKNITDDAGGDFIASAKNQANYSAMVCWESLLTTDNTLNSLAIETRVSATGATGDFRWVIRKTGGAWYASAPVTTSTSWASYSSANPGALTWYNFTPMAGGITTVGSVATIDMLGIDIVGFFANFVNAAANPYCALQTRYFQASGITPPVPLVSYETGLTIMSVRSAAQGALSVIVGASYEGTMLAMDYSGNILWTNPLTGFMVRDIWCADLDNDGTDEVLVAVADGSIHCLKLSDGTSFWAQPFKPNDVPMNAVCAIRSTPTSRYVVCGGFDLNMYYLSASGTLLNTIPSSTYSDLQPWGDGKDYFGRTIGKAHSINFLRPIPQSDNTDKLVVLGFQNHMQVSGRLYEFAPLATMPTITRTIPNGNPIGALRVVDPDNNGTYDLLMGTSELTEQFFHTINRDTDTSSTYGLTGIGTTGYRVTQPEIIPDGASFKYFMICGTHILLLPPDQNPAQVEKIVGTDGYNDMWRDPRNNRILLASSQSGGSSIHILDTSQPNWKTAFQNLVPAGKIQTIKTNFNAVKTNLNTFTKPAWERTPLKVIETQGDPANALAVSLTATYQNPVFLNGPNIGTEERTWRTLPAPVGIPNTAYQNKIDTRQTYDQTQAQILTAATSAYANSKATSGIAFWGGHGNDPYYYQPGTLKQILDIAQTRAQNQKTVFIWPEISGSDADFEQVLDHLFFSLAAHDTPGDLRMFIRNKNIYWQAGVHQPAWQRIISGEFKNNFVAALEETTDKTMELSLAGRLGLWASGSMNEWGMRCSRDNPSFDRSRQHSYQRLPNHFLRNMVHNISLGSRYLNNTYVDYDHMSLTWELIAKGALFVPKRQEIVSFSPVHLSITSPDERYMREGADNKWTVFYNAAEEAANPMVFSRMNGTWPAAKTTDWDFSRYAAGVKERRQNFIPPYENGMVLITPVANGMRAAPATFRSPLRDNLHPMYRNILKEYISDGRNYLNSDNATTYPANGPYYQTVAADIQSKKSLLPVTVSGDVAWVAAQTSPKHLRLTLVDSGYINPKARTATVSFHTVTPASATDLLDGTVFNVSNPASVSISVPLGMFRFIDVELTQPFWPTWSDFVSSYTLNGNFNSDADNDGQVDALEYALGGDPKNSNKRGITPTLTFNSGDNSYSFRNRKRTRANPGITYIAEWSETMAPGSWSSTWTQQNTTSTTDPEFDEIENRVNVGTKSRMFFRLRIAP